MIGDGRNRHTRRSSVDTDESPEGLLAEGPPGLGLNLAGNLGLLSGMNHSPHAHPHGVNPLSLSMGAEEDMGIR